MAKKTINGVYLVSRTSSELAEPVHKPGRCKPGTVKASKFLLLFAIEADPCFDIAV